MVSEVRRQYGRFLPMTAVRQREAVVAHESSRAGHGDVRNFGGVNDIAQYECVCRHPGRQDEYATALDEVAIGGQHIVRLARRQAHDMVGQQFYRAAQAPLIHGVLDREDDWIEVFAQGVSCGHVREEADPCRGESPIDNGVLGGARRVHHDVILQHIRHRHRRMCCLREGPRAADRAAGPIGRGRRVDHTVPDAASSIAISRLSSDEASSWRFVATSVTLSRR